MTHTTSHRSLVTVSAAKARRDVTDGAATLAALKVAAHRADRRAARMALRAAELDDDMDLDIAEVTRVTSHHVS